MNLVRWNSPRTMSDIFDDLFDNSFHGRHKMGIDRVPSTNIKENEGNFELDIAVPGMKKEDFKLSLENNILTISCEKESQENTENENYTRREFSYGNFCRSFSLPKSVDAEKIDARYTDGILYVNLPKKEEEKTKLLKTIEVA